MKMNRYGRNNNIDGSGNSTNAAVEVDSINNG
jgi:hypothetical protein